MPRHPDPDLERRILDGAQTLWKRGGEKALTMRAVARAARSNTPAVYRRFKNRREIVRGLLRRIQQEIGVAIVHCRTVEAIGEAYLDYAVSHPHEYELFFSQIRDLTPRARTGRALPLKEFRPNVWLLQERLVERFGGKPENHLRLALALAAAANGTALLLITEFLSGQENELRKAFTATVKAILREASRGFRGRKNAAGV